ncbi:MAG: flagellar biosynthetic protein FliQ [Gammaproteobacteria bacterium]|nr:flagellar biosynthetic protein FliQ [Gammaproteobacteria bacterium]
MIAFIQAATQLQEQTFQYAAKFFAIVLVIFLTASLSGHASLRHLHLSIESCPAGRAGHHAHSRRLSGVARVHQ